MAENFFTDFPDRIKALERCGLNEIYEDLETAFGEKGFYSSASDAMDFYKGALQEIGKFCANEVRPSAARIDDEGASLADGTVTLPKDLESHLRRCVELGVFAAPVARRYGGLNMPRAVQLVALELFGHACPNTALTVAAFSMADFIQAWGTEDQKALYMAKLLSNEWRTSMALTEPGAGSDLGSLRSSARRDGDHWLIDGTKQFISYGDAHISFALVRTDPASRGLKGLSVLIVPRTVDGRENFRVTKIEDKVCLHGSPTCELVFENSRGELLGPEGEGFRVMADLMNGARLAMAALAVGIAAAALDEARRYGRTRVTMGRPIIEHPMVADMLFEMETEIHAMRALVLEAGLAFDKMSTAKALGRTAEYERWKKRYRRLTPLCKYLCAERTIAIAKNAMQIFGGYGVCRDYPAERLLREALIYPIYEGTSQIQSLMVLKDTMKDIAGQAAGFLGSLAGAWAESLVARDRVKGVLLEARNELNLAIKSILMGILKDKFRSDIDALKQSKIQEFLRDFSLKLFSEKTDLTHPFLCAERLTRITADYYALKSMADRCPPGDADYRRKVLDFAAMALPRMRYENTVMRERLPLTLDYMARQPKA